MFGSYDVESIRREMIKNNIDISIESLNLLSEMDKQISSLKLFSPKFNIL